MSATTTTTAKIWVTVDPDYYDECYVHTGHNISSAPSACQACEWYNSWGETPRKHDCEYFHYCATCDNFVVQVDDDMELYS